MMVTHSMQPPVVENKPATPGVSHGQARGNLPSEHSEREGGAQQALPVGGATRVPAGRVEGAPVIEERLKPTLIRRRAKAEVAEKPVPETVGPEAKAAERTQPAAASVVIGTNAPQAAQGPAPATAKAVGTAVSPPTRVGILPSKVGQSQAAKAAEDAAAALKKPARKKKSKEEWVMEDIKKAGGLKHFAYVADLAPGEVEKEITETAEVVEGVDVPETPDVPEVPEAAPQAPAAAVEPVERIERVFHPSERRRKKPLRRDFKKTQITQMKASKRVIRMEEKVTIAELSQAMGVKGNALIQKLVQLGVMATINQTVDADTATLLAQDYGFEIERSAKSEEELLAPPAARTNKGEEKVTTGSVGRPPVVTVMGHVDHGKTSILDAVRKTDVAAGEAGGITQHIGASAVTTPKGLITFIDTPGHAAFTALRARGARITDVVVLVVAADDGVMPQTKEAIDHAKAAGVPIIVAVNKMDKPDANPDRVKRELSENGLVPEEWGGDVICAPTSARTKEGIDHLLEMILLQAELLELKADPTASVKGTVIEARLSRGRGPVATVVVQEGTLRPGAPIVCGTASGRVRALIDPDGRQTDAVTPGCAAEVIGLDSVPVAGEIFVEAQDERTGKLVAENRLRKQREANLGKMARVSLEDLHKQIAAGETKTLNVVVKADVQGSAEAVADALSRVGTEVVKVEVLHRGVGGISESDVLLAAASRAIIIGFNVVPDRGAARLASLEGVNIKRYSIIYELLDDVKKALEGLLAPTRTEKVIGRAEVRQAFNISKIGTIAGSSVVSGRIARSAQARLVRDSVVVHQGKLGSIKRFKDDAREVTEGMECGIGFENFQDIKPGDIIECFIIEETAATL